MTTSTESGYQSGGAPPPSFSVVIVGGGAGGLELAAGLAKDGCKDILLIDHNTSHVWKPRLHEMAAGLGFGEVDALSYAGLAEKWGFAYQQGELHSVSPDDGAVTLAAIENEGGVVVVRQRRVAYKCLVLAIGGSVPDFGTEGVLEHAFRLVDGNDAERLFKRFSQGLLACSLSGAGRPFEIVIVGSGATGVELAAHLKQDHLCAALAPRSALPEIRVTIIEAAEQILSGVQDDVRRDVRGRLENIGIRIETGKQVSRLTADDVQTKDGTLYPSDLTVWTTGTVGPPVSEQIGSLETNKRGQWLVTSTLQTTTSNAIFALGDCCALKDDPAPTTAQAAGEQAEHLIANLPRWLAGEPVAHFKFQNKGTLLSLGAGGSIANLKKSFGDDILINGRLARAAYQGLYRQHQYHILGLVKGTEEVVAVIFEKAIGPRLKVFA